jgi:hypothetical protein
VRLARPRERATLIDDPTYHEVYDSLVRLLSTEIVNAA